MKDAAQEVSKAIPPLVVSGFSLFSHPLADWAVMITLIYTVLMLFFLIRDKMFYPFMEYYSGGLEHKPPPKETIDHLIEVKIEEKLEQDISSH